MNMNANKYLVEFIGTFFLVLAVGMNVINPGSGTRTPLAIGATLMVMIYAGGHVSGAHYNPAVTLAVWLRGRCPKSDVLPYMGSQFVAGVLAAMLVLFLKKNPMVIPQQLDIFPAFLAELIGTFALAYVVLNVATAKSTAGNSYFGLAIGFTVTTMAFALGGISGGAFNPAVALGITIMHLTSVPNVWIYLVANFAGGALAAMAFRFICPEDK